MVVQFVHCLYLLSNYVGKDSALDSEQSCRIYLLVVRGHPCLKTHPERDSAHYLQYDATERPYIHHPRFLVLLDEFELNWIVVQAVLKQNIVEDLRRHILGRRHGELFEVGEEETGAEVYYLYLFEQELTRQRFLPEL